jgi:hypothetical protein
LFFFRMVFESGFFHIGLFLSKPTSSFRRVFTE